MRLLFSDRTDRQVDFALLLVRLALAAVFIAHGWQKVFVYGFEGVAGGFAQMGIPAPELMGPFVALVELLGGLALLIGLLARLAALALAIDMLVATLVVHLSAGFFLPKGYEFTLTLLLGCLAIVLAGPGRLSADARLGAARR